MEPSMNNFSGPEKIPTPFIGVEKISPETIEYESEFSQIQEDLKYMFDITVTNEKELHSDEIRKKIYEVSIKDLKEGIYFTLEYFVEKKILSADDIKKENIPMLRECALKIISTTKNITRLKNVKKLFNDLGILTEEEMGSAVSH